MSASFRVLKTIVLVLTTSTGAGSLATIARAGPCPNEQIRLQEMYAASLPDCRAYEQVSPLDKNLSDAVGGVEVDLSRSSSSGERAVFVSISPFPGIPGANQFPTYLSIRHANGGGEWLTQGLLPATEAGANASVQALTEDLSAALVSVGSSLHIYNTAEMLLAPFPTAEAFSPAGFFLSDTNTDDSRILFESTTALPGTKAAPGVSNLYEWENGRLLLVGVLPEGVGTPIGGVVAGPGGEPNRRGSYYTQGTLSANGLRVSFTDLETRQIYMRVREPPAENTIEVSPGPAEWQATTSDGSYVFYTEEGKLYRFNVNAALSNQPEEKAHAHEELTSGPAEVLGTVGTSESGSYAYFVARSIQAGQNPEGKKPGEGSNNLYEWHANSAVPIHYIANLESSHDKSDWRNFKELEVGEAAEGEKSSRVAADGKTLLFSSDERLTKYNNNKRFELYLYSALSGRLTCVSCNPSGQPATTGAYIIKEEIKYNVIPVPPRPFFMTRNLSADGSRVFFQTEEALVPKDTNGLSDVYEWEKDHLYLISSGQGNNVAYFSDASTDGNNVFFFTRQPLVSQDQDDNVDLYDARVNSGIAAQNPVVVPPCVGEECHSAITSPPVFGTPSSATFSGAGNLAPQLPAPSLTTAQKLAVALKICRKQPRKKRAACETRAKKEVRLGKSAAKKTAKRRRT